MPSLQAHPLMSRLVHTAPVADRWRAALRQRVAGWGLAVWEALEQLGRRRAERELLAQADRWRATNPTLARELRSYARGGSSY